MRSTMGAWHLGSGPIKSPVSMRIIYTGTILVVKRKRKGPHPSNIGHGPTGYLQRMMTPFPPITHSM
jgi:hypothetical protein